MTIVQTSALVWVGTTADTVSVRSGAAIPRATIGSMFIETDMDRRFLFDGTNWLLLENRVINEAHKQIHDGEMWEVSNITESVVNDANLDLVLSVGATPMHTTMAMSAEGSALVRAFEGVELNATPGGSAATVRNANRVIGDAGAPTALIGPTIDSVGTLMIEFLSAGGFGGVSPGVNGDRNTEQILAANTDYLFRLTNKRGSAAILSWVLTGYEGALV